MVSIVISNNSELLRHMNSAPFRRMNMEISVVRNGVDAVSTSLSEDAELVILDLNMEEQNGYDASKLIKEKSPSTQIILALGARMSVIDSARIAESGCDGVLMMPIDPETLYDEVAARLHLSRRGEDRSRKDTPAIIQDGSRRLDGRAIDLSLRGARVLLSEPLGEGTQIVLHLSPDAGHEPSLMLDGRVVWASSRDNETIAGIEFLDLSDESLTELSRLTRWEILEGYESTRLLFKGALDESTSFTELESYLNERIELDLSRLRYIDSLGIARWNHFFSRFKNADCHLYACSTAFVLQASLSSDVIGRRRIVSFYAPYRCGRCNFEEERLFETSAIVLANKQPPLFSCPACQCRTFELDDSSERFFDFIEA